MAQSDAGIGNVTANTGLVEMAMAYARSRVLCAAARLGIADALGDETRSVGFLAESCQAHADALYRLLRALAGIGVTEETTPEHFRLTPFGKPLRKDVPQSVWASPTVFEPPKKHLSSAIQKYPPAGRRILGPARSFAQSWAQLRLKITRLWLQPGIFPAPR